MHWIDAIFWWVGATVCGLGAAAAVAAIASLAVDYIYRHWCNFETFMRVVKHARDMGVSLHRDQDQ